jgi:hypothetical protein
MHRRDLDFEEKIYENSRIFSSHSAPLSCSMCDEISIKQLSQLKSIKWNDTNTYRENESCCAVIFPFYYSLPLSAHTENESLTVLDYVPLLSSSHLSLVVTSIVQNVSLKKFMFFFLSLSLLLLHFMLMAKPILKSSLYYYCQHDGEREGRVCTKQL